MNQPSTPESLPVVVIGAGPIGLSASLQLHTRGLAVKVLEGGGRVGSAMRKWGHVRMFSPWRYTIDPAAAAALERTGWVSPDLDSYPTGTQVVGHYLEPLAATAEVAPSLVLGTWVTGVTRLHHDRMRDGERNSAPFVVRYRDERGVEGEIWARGVIDASGTFHQPNPLGTHGLPALGETAAKDYLSYGIPEVRGAHQDRFAGRRVLVVGSGHSAFNVLADLVALRDQFPSTTIHWAIRRPNLDSALGGGEQDELVERGRLGQTVAGLLKQGALQLHPGTLIDRVVTTANGVTPWAGDRQLPEVDHIVVATGFRPDLSMFSELRLAFDPATESSAALGPLIDPNVHSCGTVKPHGAIELAHPEANFYVVGMKSYGRAPTFLLRTGYEQVRSVAAALAGDWQAARRVEWVLPQTGVCSGPGGGLQGQRACCAGAA